MKYYTYNGKTTKHLPDPLKLEEGGYVSPMTEERFVAFGGVITEDEEPTHMEELEAAMQSFREICYAIATFIHDPDFKGGINEIEKLYTSEYAQANQQMAMMLAMRWQGADRQCNHFASKDDVGLDSPKWWYICWDLPIPDEVSNPSNAHEVTVEPDPVVLAMLEQQAQEESNEATSEETTEEPEEVSNEEPEEDNSEDEIVDDEGSGDDENSAEPS